MSPNPSEVVRHGSRLFRDYWPSAGCSLSVLVGTWQANLQSLPTHAGASRQNRHPT